jgi:hypothetical protein
MKPLGSLNVMKIVWRWWALRNGQIFTKGQTLTKGLFFALDKPWVNTGV